MCSYSQYPGQGSNLSVRGQMDKENMEHGHRGIPASHRERKNAVCGNMDGRTDYCARCLEVIVLQGSQAEKDRYVTCGM